MRQSFPDVRAFWEMQIQQVASPTNGFSDVPGQLSDSYPCRQVRGTLFLLPTSIRCLCNPLSSAITLLRSTFCCFIFPSPFLTLLLVPHLSPPTGAAAPSGCPLKNHRPIRKDQAGTDKDRGVARTHPLSVPANQECPVNLPTFVTQATWQTREAGNPNGHTDCRQRAGAKRKTAWRKSTLEKKSNTVPASCQKE